MPINLSPTPRPIQLEGEEPPVEILVSVVLDASGSMKGTEESTRSCYNNYLDSLEEDTKANYKITLTQFRSLANGQPLITIDYADQPLKTAPRLTQNNYKPDGGTPLNDAIGQTMTQMKEILAGRPALLVILTDGEENTSKQYTKAQIKAMISEMAEQGWTAVFLGANIDSFAEAAGYGILAQNVANYAQSAGGYASVSSGLASATRSYSNNRTNALRASRRPGGQSVNTVKQFDDEKFFTDEIRSSFVEEDKTDKS